jgi:hypothetical protein
MTTEVKSIHTATFGKPNKSNLPATLFHIWGFATSTFKTHSKFGEQTGLKGDFYAVSPTGEKVFSEAAFLPSSLMDQIVERLNVGETEIEFKATVRAVPSDKNPSGYAFTVDEPMTEERQSRRAMLAATVEKQSVALLTAK